ncbi:unnamed protein product [Linum trigynum]|uniref:CCHC-type domain-containing protein n=1 Tax=Linum trigynum TaxID=586398 RepID=A0AAV2CS01_9ROSI
MLKFKNDQKRYSEESRPVSYDRNKSNFQERLPQQQTRHIETGQQNREPQACYKCGKFGHIRANCPLTIRAKEKAMKASWSDYDSEPEANQSDEEAYMATEVCHEATEIALQSNHSDQDNKRWYLDSGCSHHMSGKRSLFSTITLSYGGKVLFGEWSW